MKRQKTAEVRGIPVLNRLTIGTRKSPLAMWQTEYVKAQLEKIHSGVEISIVQIVTSGDKSQDSMAPIPLIGGKGLFTAELEEALRMKSIDLAVHCLKDLPTTLDPEFVIGAIPQRASPFDVLITKSGKMLQELPEGAVIGTSSIRRAAQLKRIRPDLRTKMIRGNVETRISKMHNDGYDAIVLAKAGLERLGKVSVITQELSEAEMLPAPGQGALAIQCRHDDEVTHRLIKALHHVATEQAVTAERAFLHALGAGCNTPVAALATIEDVAGDYVLTITGRCLSVDGLASFEYSASGAPEQAHQLGERCAQQALADGFKKVGSLVGEC